MPTANQLVRKPRVKKKRSKRKYTATDGAAHMRGTVLNIRIQTPKKPNSAKRIIARVKLNNGKEVTAKVPGKGTNLQEHHRVLVRPGRTKDLPGVKYKIILGVYDAHGTQPEKERISGSYQEVPRKNGRSRYGVKSGVAPNRIKRAAKEAGYGG